MTEITLAPYGVHADGTPTVPAVSYTELAQMAKLDEESQDGGEGRRTRGFLSGILKKLGLDVYGNIAGLGPIKARFPQDSDVGWGIVYHQSVPQAVRDELDPLVAHRKGRKLPEWIPGESLRHWLAAQGINPRNELVDFRVLPYYILFVGSPSQIRLEFQYELDRFRAVGRLDLGDDPEDYRTYVESVLAYEASTPLPVGRRVALIGARNGEKDVTRLSADHLIPALAALPGTDPELQGYDYQVASFASATKDQLKSTLRPDAAGRSPALAFVASHGVSFDKGTRRQEHRQGAWVTSEWQGGPIARRHYLAGADVGPDFCAPGSILFSLACFGAGTCRTSEYARYYNRLATRKKTLATGLSERSFVAALPQRLLSYRRKKDNRPAGALAYVGHVDLSWEVLFWDAEQEQVNSAAPETFVQQILLGNTVGWATQTFTAIVNARNRALTGYMDNLDGFVIGGREQEIALTYIERNNAQGFIILGDPAVRIDPDKLPQSGRSS